MTLRVKPEALPRCLDEAGLCFCFAPAHHPAMKHAAPVRQALGFRTLFNLVGPLTNPAGTKRQVLGVFAPGLTELMANVLEKLGGERAMVVHGEMPGDDGGPAKAIDELSVCGPSRVTELRDGAVATRELDPTDLGLPFGLPSALTADGPDASAKIITDVLAGQHGPARDIVLLNAAAALVVGGVATDLSDGLRRAAEAVDQGAARQALDTLVKLTAEGAATS